MSPIQNNTSLSAIPSSVVSTFVSSEGYLRPKDAWMLLGIGRSSFYAMQQEGSPQFVESFPKPYQISGRTKVWSKSELIAWVESRAVSAQGGEL